MSARTNEGQRIAFNPIDENPISLDVAVAKALPLALQRVVIMDRRKGYALPKLVNNPRQFVEVVASTVH